MKASFLSLSYFQSSLLLLLGQVILPIITITSLVVLEAAPVPDFKGDVETYEWKGSKRTLFVRKMKCGDAFLELVKIPKGSFTMGSDQTQDPSSLAKERPPHKVTFTRDLWVAKYPVTKGQFAQFVKATRFKTEAESDDQGGSGFDVENLTFKHGKIHNWKNTGWDQSDNHPVVNVSWNDAAAFCHWISTENKLQSGYVKHKDKWDLVDYNKHSGIRLLTEAEYEYANRGGTKSIYLSGSTIASMENYVNIQDINYHNTLRTDPHRVVQEVEYDDGEPFTSRVGKYKPNGFGLYDMTGNVSSWCVDWVDEKLYVSRKDGVCDPQPNKDGEQKFRAVRGSSWLSPPLICRVARRHGFLPSQRYFDLGFRVMMD